MNTGIYEIVNTANGKRYIGSAVNFVTRWSTHRQRLNRGDNTSRHLQSSWNKHGEATFEFRKLLVCSPENLLMYEQLAIDALRPEYNIRQKADSNIGIKHSAETRAKMVLAKVGNKNILGRKYSPETLAKLSAANMGKKPSAETREKMSASRIGKPHPQSPQAKARVAAAARRRNNDHMRTTEYREARRVQMLDRLREGGPMNRKGVSPSAETRAKMSASRLGKVRGPYKKRSEVSA